MLHLLLALLLSVLKGEPAYSRARLRNEDDSYCVCPTILKRGPSGDLCYAAGAIYVKPGTKTKDFFPAEAECFVSYLFFSSFHARQHVCPLSIAKTLTRTTFWEATSVNATLGFVRRC